MADAACPEPWETCDHKWGGRWFGPVIRCRKCGAFTIISMDPKESKPIFGPNTLRDDGEAKR